MSSKSCQYLYSEYAMKFRQDFLGSLYLKGLVRHCTLGTIYKLTRLLGQTENIIYIVQFIYIYSTYDESEVNKNITKLSLNQHVLYVQEVFSIVIQ